MSVSLLMNTSSPTITTDFPTGHECQGLLFDFITDQRVLLVGSLAVLIGAIAALVAKTRLSRPGLVAHTPPATASRCAEDIPPK